jgi:hypothetical protein
VTARYQRKVTNDDDSFSFDTQGGTAKMYSPKQRMGIYPAPGKSAPTRQYAIGETDHDVEGVEVVIPQLKFTEKHTLPYNAVDREYIVSLARLTGTVCAGSFRLFDIGEVLFVGASGSKEPMKDPEISFSFVASQNATDLQIGDITGITKRGHDYLWIRYCDQSDDDAHTMVKTPEYVFVEQVYDYRDWSGLGIA